MQKARQDCEALWELFESYADRNFRDQIRRDFYPRYWEMYLTTFLIREGYAVCCPKPDGLDVGIEFEGRPVWFEATSPTRGKDGAPDQVPALVAGGDEAVAREVPNESMVLRYLNSISTKYKCQFKKWLGRGIVGPDDAFVIAINPRRLDSDIADTDPPRILQAAFTWGSPYIIINTDTLRTVDSGYQFRDAITKASGKPVPTGVFHLDEYAGLSGLLCSRVDAVNKPEEMGANFQLVPTHGQRFVCRTTFA
jgi:hypothetical protein